MRKNNLEKLQIVDRMLFILQAELADDLETESKDIFKFIQRIREIIAEILVCLK